MMGIFRHTDRKSTARCKIIAILLVVFLVGGCVIPLHRGAVNETPPVIAHQVTKHFPTSLYRLASGDVLQFLYLFMPVAGPTPYKIRAEDQVDIEFNFHPELNRTVRVRPDGKISIPRKGEAHVAGRTPEAVRLSLQRVYADLLKDPEITVTVREFHSRLDAMRTSLATGPNGQARLINVAPDGTVALPMIPAMRAEGFTIAQLTESVNRTYHRLVPGVKVSVLLQQVAGNIVFVDGQVTTPGVYTSPGLITVQRAIAMAGGTLASAEPRSVLVISKGPDGRFITRCTDLTKLTSASDFPLRGGDMVYVPRSYIARADVWVDQNIRQLIMFTGWSLGLSGDLGRSTER
jgi:protein involved in polysaccharide export with SLBB domain